MPSLSGVNDPEVARAFAEFISAPEYDQRQQAADEFGITVKTVTRWAKDPRVREICRELRESREEKTLRRITNELQRRINSKTEIEQMDVKTLLDIRKQILGPNLGKDEDPIDNADVVALLEDNPDVAEALTLALTPRSSKVPSNAPKR